MRDERLRMLERLWRETGSVEDEANYLRARIRLGHLLVRDVQVAAHCGVPSARLLDIISSSAVPFDEHNARAWADCFGAWGRSTCLEVACVAIDPVLEKWERLALDVTESASEVTRLTCSGVCAKSLPRRCVAVLRSNESECDEKLLSVAIELSRASAFCSGLIRHESEAAHDLLAAVSVALSFAIGESTSIASCLLVLSDVYDGGWQAVVRVLERHYHDKLHSSAAHAGE